MGEHLDLGHTVFVVAALLQPILLSIFPPLLRRFSQMKEQLLDLFSAWLLWSGSSRQSVMWRPSPAGYRPCRHCDQ